MKIGIILNTDDLETVWNSFRFGVISLEARHDVKIFLIGNGVKIDELKDNKKFDISVKIKEYLEKGGQILSCGTCMKLRRKTQSKTCPIATMKDMLKIIEESDKVITFG